MFRLRTLAFGAAAATYLLIVLGAWVRITGSGMGCGDDWPLCHGRIIPPLSDLPTLIEWSHRLAALGVSILVAAVAAAALVYGRRTPGAGRVVRPAVLALVLLVGQVLLGAITVWLELPPVIVTLHLATALALLAALLVTALRAEAPAHPPTNPPRHRKPAVAALALGATVLVLGGATASLGAGPSCQGFPLCSGQWWPTGAASGLPQIHWLHRLAAYGLVLHLAGMSLRARQLPSGDTVRRATWTAMSLALAQVVIAVVMVLGALPAEWRALHAAAGTGVWAALVWLATAAAEA